MKDPTVKRIVKEVKQEFKISLKNTPIDEVDDPEPILKFMVNTAMNWHHKDHDCWAIGKQLQMTNWKIPFKTQLEVSAGFWHLINTGKI